MSLKIEIKELLENREFDRLVDLAGRETKTIRYLISFLYSEDESLRWRAAEGLGALAKRPDIIGEEKIDNITTRLFISLEDQSGGNGWGSMEGIGAIVAARPYEYSKLIPKMFSFIWDGRVRKGLLWSVRKIGEKRPDLLKDNIIHVVGLLRNPSNTVRGHAAWALGTIGDADRRVIEGLVVDVVEALKGLLDDDSVIHIYNDGELKKITIGEIAKEALAALEGDKVSAGKPEINFDFSI